MTTALFSVLDRMEAAGLTVPELAQRIEVERVLPVQISDLPSVSIIPRRTQVAGVGGEVQGRQAMALVIVRVGGENPGRRAHELLSLLHAAFMTDPDLNDGSVQLDLGTETFRYIDTEQSICDLQAEYEVVFDHSRTSLD